MRINKNNTTTKKNYKDTKTYRFYVGSQIIREVLTKRKVLCVLYAKKKKKKQQQQRTSVSLYVRLIYTFCVCVCVYIFTYVTTTVFVTVLFFFPLQLFSCFSKSFQIVAMSLKKKESQN